MPYQLQHSVATIITAQIGLEAARQALGQISLEMDNHYVKPDAASAVEAVRRVKIDLETPTQPPAVAKEG